MPHITRVGRQTHTREHVIAHVIAHVITRDYTCALLRIIHHGGDDD